MTATTRLLIVLLSQQGHWFGGQENSISLQWAAPDHSVEAVIEWRLSAGAVELARDHLAMRAGANAVQIRITPPEVRVRTTLQWSYRLLAGAEGGEIERGDRILHVYPTDLLAAAGKQLEGKRVLLLDRPGELSNLLKEAAIPHKRLVTLQALQFARGDILIVAPDEIGGDVFEQSPILNHANAGTSVCMLAQPRAMTLGGYAVRRRAAPAAFEWRLTHPLLRGMEAGDLRSLLGDKATLPAVQLPVDEPALEIGWWPREIPSSEPAPIDALLLSKRVGEGRLVLCQLPFDSFATDPRAQQFLSNALGYLATRPEPTPSPSHRQVARAPATMPVPTITISPGGVP